MSPPSALPDYWLERPPFELDGAARTAVDEFLAAADGDGAGFVDADRLLDDRHDVTRWKFLCGVAERREVAFHGTGDPGITRFEPRRPIDFAPFGDRQAVFATSDPIWAMFYAIVDRERYDLTLNNGCIAVLDEDGRRGPPHYYFSVSRRALADRPWRTGHVYFLPGETFVEQPPGPYGGHTARVPQLASALPVEPFARVRVAPADFPFLAAIRGHEDERLAEYAAAVMTAAPWPE